MLRVVAALEPISEEVPFEVSPPTKPRILTNDELAERDPGFPAITAPDTGQIPSCRRWWKVSYGLEVFQGGTVSVEVRVLVLV
jgi:hypothetical protein